LHIRSIAMFADNSRLFFITQLIFLGLFIVLYQVAEYVFAMLYSIGSVGTGKMLVIACGRTAGTASVFLMAMGMAASPSCG